MLDTSELKRFYPLVATPCYGGTLFYTYVISIVRLMAAAARVEMPVELHFRAGDSLVTRARNDCVATFLSDHRFTHLFWIDGDIGFSPEAAFRLFQADRDVVAGVYPLKRDEWPAEGLPAGMTKRGYEELYARYPVNAGGKEGASEVRLDVDADGFMKVHDAPTGFMLIKRSVFDLLIEKYPDYRYVPDWPPGTFPEGGVHYRFFDTMVDPKTRRLLSEDYAFCRLLQNLGVDIFVDANSNLTHLGTKLYTGEFGSSLKAAPTGAIGAVKGARITVGGVDRLKPNP
jgi:hypothetical protein